MSLLKKIRMTLTQEMSSNDGLVALLRGTTVVVAISSDWHVAFVRSIDDGMIEINCMIHTKNREKHLTYDA